VIAVPSTVVIPAAEHTLDIASRVVGTALFVVQDPPMFPELSVASPSQPLGHVYPATVSQNESVSQSGPAYRKMLLSLLPVPTSHANS
jgi:hypothetical protein